MLCGCAKTLVLKDMQANVIRIAVIVSFSFMALSFSFVSIPAGMDLGCPTSGR
jgi:hypothetical protein